MTQKERDLFKKAILDTVIPDNTNASITDVLDDTEDDESPSEGSLLHIKQRSLLFFDERLTVYVILQLPSIPEDRLKSYLSRLDIKVDVWVLSSLASTGESSAVANPTSDLVFSTPVRKTDDPILLVKGDETSEDGGVSMLVLWEAEVILNRPRIRFQNPTISIVASAILSPETVKEVDPNKEYLPSFQPAEYNIFEPLKSVKGLEQNLPYLAVSRLERVFPQVPKEETAISIRAVTSRSTPVVPAVSARTRFTKMTGALGGSETITSLDFEVTPFVELEICLEQVECSLANGKVEDLMPLDLPTRCSTKECLTFIYRLHPNQQTPAIGAPSVAALTVTNGTLSISINANITLSPVCTPKIRIAWKASIDFSQALNPSFGPPSQPIQRMKRPNSLPFTTTTAQSPSSTNIPLLMTTTQAAGLNISFTAPSHPIYANDPFVWSVHVENRTTKPAKLALIPLPHISRTTTTSISKRHHAPKSSTASFHVTERRHTRPEDEVDIAQAICDENIVYALQHSGAAVSAGNIDLLSLTAELRIGPLGPGTCHESEIRLVALRPGALRCDAVRIVDLMKEMGEESGGANVIDITELPDVIVVDRG